MDQQTLELAEKLNEFLSEAEIVGVSSNNLPGLKEKLNALCVQLVDAINFQNSGYDPSEEDEDM